MAQQCISHRCWCSPWPLLGHQAEVSWAESAVEGHWSACPRWRILFSRNRREYCCTNTRVERSLMLEGLAGQAASTGRRTGSCCCSCCRSAISVGEARWSGPLEPSQCLPTAPLHCPSAPWQLLSTVCRCFQTAPLHCPSAPWQLLSTVCRCLQTAPIHCPSASLPLRYTVSVPPDSSSPLQVPPDSSPTLSPGWLVYK